MKSEKVQSKWGEVEVRGMNGADYRFYVQSLALKDLDGLNQGLLDRCVSGAKLPQLAATAPGEMDEVLNKIEELTDWPKPVEEFDPKN